MGGGISRCVVRPTEPRLRLNDRKSLQSFPRKVLRILNDLWVFYLVSTQRGGSGPRKGSEKERDSTSALRSESWTLCRDSDPDEEPHTRASSAVGRPGVKGVAFLAPVLNPGGSRETRGTVTFR